MRLIGYLGLVVLVGVSLYLGLRQDSCFFSVPWMPRKIAVPIQHATMYRNLIGFGLIGLYVGLVFGKGSRWRDSRRAKLLVLALLVLPVAKESLQWLMPGRHCTLTGALLGLSGMALGLCLGKLLRDIAGFVRESWFPSQIPMSDPNTRTRLDLFDARVGLDRGRPGWYEALWYLVKCAFFLSPLPWPSGWKTGLLRAFGAKVGQAVVIKPRVNIHFPWKLEIGDHVWIGEEVFILNFESVQIGSHACISQRAFLCGGNHDYRDPGFRYRNGPIQIGAGAWVGAQVFVAPNVALGTDCVVSAGSIVTKSLPAGFVCAGNPCVAIKSRWP